MCYGGHQSEPSIGRLIREGRLSEKQLQGLGEDKLESIRSYAKLLAKLEEVALKTWRLMNDRSSARSTGTVIRLSEPYTRREAGEPRLLSTASLQ